VLVNLPLVVLTIVAIWIYAPESRDEAQTPLDPVGALLSIAGLGALVYAIIQGGEDGWTSGPVLAAAATAAITLAAFVRWERNSPHPMLPLTLFRDRRLSVGSGVISIAFFALFGFFFLITEYLQFGRQYSPLAAGLALLPLPITFVAVSPQSAALAARFGAARVMAVGLAIVGAGFGILAGLTPDTPYAVLALAFVVLGAGMGMTAAPATGEIMSAVPASKAGVGSAINDTTRELGGALGIAVLGSIATSAYRAAADFGGIGLGAGARSQAEESIGAAARVAQQLGGAGIVKARAAAAFADAVQAVSLVSIGLVLAAAIAVLVVARARRGDPTLELVDDLGDELGEEPIRFEAAMVTAGVGGTPE
jgi:hypothetical protein